MDEDVGKHRKKRESNRSKSQRKARHKHMYEPCMIEISGNAKYLSGRLYGGTYCTICGKIQNIEYGIDELVNGHSMIMTRLEVEDKYKGCPRFVVNDILQDYVTLVKKERSNTES